MQVCKRILQHDEVKGNTWEIKLVEPACLAFIGQVYEAIGNTWEIRLVVQA